MRPKLVEIKSNLIVLVEPEIKQKTFDKTIQKCKPEDIFFKKNRWENYCIAATCYLLRKRNST